MHWLTRICAHNLLLLVETAIVIGIEFWSGFKGVSEAVVLIFDAIPKVLQPSDIGAMGSMSPPS